MKKANSVSLFILVSILALTNCQPSNQKNTATADTEDYLKKGMDIALATKAVLGKNLFTAIQSKGTDGALAFCNERAIPLTDSMSINLHADIKRVSDKNRNPNNAANETELQYIKQAKAEIANSGKASPKLIEREKHFVGMYPIMTDGICLQCHGQPGKDINEATLNMIQQKYPDDKAIGYSGNELRGIWVVKMDK